MLNRNILKRLPHASKLNIQKDNGLLKEEKEKDGRQGVSFICTTNNLVFVLCKGFSVD